MPVQPIPEGANSVNAYLVVKDGEKASKFYQKAFGGTGGVCLRGPDGSFMHGEVRIGNSTVMLSEENPQWAMKSAETLGDSPVSLHLYVEDVDTSFQQAIDAGCSQVSPVMDMFWGDRYGKVMDPFGFQWGIATHQEDVPEAEMADRAKKWMEQMAQGGGDCGENA